MSNALRGSGRGSTRGIGRHIVANSLRGIILQLKIGEVLFIEDNEIKTARTYAGQLQWQWGRTWHVSSKHKVIWRSF